MQEDYYHHQHDDTRRHQEDKQLNQLMLDMYEISRKQDVDNMARASKHYATLLLLPRAPRLPPHRRACEGTSRQLSEPYPDLAASHECHADRIFIENGVPVRKYYHIDGLHPTRNGSIHYDIACQTNAGFKMTVSERNRNLERNRASKRKRGDRKFAILDVNRRLQCRIESLKPGSPSHAASDHGSSAACGRGKVRGGDADRGSGTVRGGSAARCGGCQYWS